MEDRPRIAKLKLTRPLKRKTRGRWTDERDKTLLQSYIRFRPHRASYGQKVVQLRKIREEVNKHGLTDRIPPLALTTIKDRNRVLFNKYGFPTRHGSPPEGGECLAYQAWQMQEKDVKGAENQKAKKKPLVDESAMPREMPHIKQEAEMEEEDETNPTTAPESTEQHHDWSKHYAELLVAIHEQTMEMKQLSSVLNNIVTVISTMLDRYD